MLRTILIVDDNLKIRTLLRSWLSQQAEWQVCGEAENGQEALEKIEKLRPDVVLLDLQMPVMNGLEAARQINSLFPRTSMVMLTMHASDQLVTEARAAGVKEVVSKTEMLGGHCWRLYGKSVSEPATATFF